MIQDKSTLKAVAKDAGVSPSTVSRVLNQPHLVTTRTRESVYKALRKYNYTPPSTSKVPDQEDKKNSLGVIGLIVHSLKLNVISELVSQFSDEMAKDGGSLLLLNTNGNRDLLGYMQTHPEIRKKVDALVAFSMEVGDEAARYFRDINMPVVIMQTRVNGLKSISTDNFLGGHDATEFLVSRGYKKIAFVGWNFDDVRLRGRLSGYRSVIHNVSPDDETYEAVCFEELSEKGGYTATQRLFSRTSEFPEPPDAIFYSCDVMALGGLRYAREHNLNVPQDLGVIGFDNIEAAEIAGLTTMRQFLEKKVSMALDYLKNLHTGELLEHQDVEVSITPQLTIRRTTK
jgi:LacI family transcriptional regulator